MENPDKLWQEITLESAQFIFDQAEKKLQSTIEISKSLTDRAVHVMQFSISLAIALIGVLANDPKREFLWLYLIALVVAIIISLMALHIYDFSSIRSPGHNPESILTNVTLAVDEQQLRIVFKTILDIERAIEENEAKNLERQTVFSWIMTYLKFLIGFAILYVILVVLLQSELAVPTLQALVQGKFLTA